MFYVYQHLNPQNGEPFYVGKGQGKRAFAKHNRNRYWNNKVQCYGGFEVKFIAKELDEELAFIVEMEAIDLYKRLGHKLANITNGGEGASGMVHSEETKRKIAEKATGRKGFFGPHHFTEEAREKIIASNKRRITTQKMKEKSTFKGMSHTEQHKEKMRKLMKGRVFSEETLQKMREAQRKRFSENPISQETKLKMSQSHLKGKV